MLTFDKQLFRERARRTMRECATILSWRKKMLAIQVAAEINQRWHELEKLPSLDRLHVLETLVERHVLATGPCCSPNYEPSYERTSEFYKHPANDDTDRH